MHTIKHVVHTYDKGLQGQNFVEIKCLRRGYSLYKKNLKKIGLEIDLIMYKYIQEKGLLVMRIIEVKTRSRSSLNYFDDLAYLGIDKKWIKIRRHMYIIVEDLKKHLNLQTCKHIIYFDLALVAYDSRCTEQEGAYAIYKYIENVDLLI